MSSADAQADLVRLVGKGGPVGHVLRFVPSIPEAPRATREDLEAKYGFTGRYLYLPSQFWAHKNHLTVISALGILAEAGDCLQIVCSGDLSDYRRPEHSGCVLAAIKRAGIESTFRILGSIPYQDVFDLMFHAHGVINPSLFEGWSTTVEEAKLLEKPLVLSDINVHREQAGSTAHFFERESPTSCAAALSRVWATRARTPSIDFSIHARKALADYGAQYLDLVDRCLSGHL